MIENSEWSSNNAPPLGDPFHMKKESDMGWEYELGH